MADDKKSTVASPVKTTDEKVSEVKDVSTVTPTKTPVKSSTEAVEPADPPTNGSPEKRDVSKVVEETETPNGDGTEEAAEPVVACPVKRKSVVGKDGDKEDTISTPEKKVKKDDEIVDVDKDATA